MSRRTTPRLSEAVEQFMTLRRAQLAATTCANDQSQLLTFVRGVGDPQVHQLTRNMVEDFFAGMAGQKASSWNKVRSRLATFFTWCTRRGWLTEDVLSDIRPKRVVREQRLQLSADQLTRLLQTPDPRDRAFLAVAMNTALRASTITSLKVKDLDLAQGFLRVYVTKSHYEDQLPITTDLDREMRRWLVAYAEDLGRALEPEDYLLPSRGNRRPRRSNGRYLGTMGDLRPEVRIVHAAAIVKRALSRELGIETVTGEGVHTLRRSVARLLFEEASAQGHDAALRVAASLLGHSSTAVTELYLGISADRKKRNELMRGKSLFPTQDNVVPLRQVI